MSSYFRVYVDESGDEGFTFFPPPKKGSPDWLVLSAAIVRTKEDHQCVNTLRAFRTQTGREVNAHVHWKKLKHGHKVLYAEMVSNMDVCGCSVAVHKPSITNTTAFKTPNVLYFYCVRYLMERVSWFIRDNAVRGEGDGKGELWFSKRKNLSYSDLLNYLFHLKYEKESGADIRIEFGRLEMDADKVHVLSPAKRAGLQIVDAIAGATFNALETNRFGHREPRYAKMLGDRLYTYHGKIRNYGFKVMPAEGWDFIDGECNAGRMEMFC